MLKEADGDRLDTSVKLVSSETEIPDISRKPEGESNCQLDTTQNSRFKRTFYIQTEVSEVPFPLNANKFYVVPKFYSSEIQESQKFQGKPPPVLTVLNLNLQLV